MMLSSNSDAILQTTVPCTGKPRENDLVRREYKRYKQRKPPPCFDNVIDFTRPEVFTGMVKDITSSLSASLKSPMNSWHQCGLRDPQSWKIFELKDCPGLLFIPNPFQRGSQWYWSKKAVTNYTVKPFPSNMDIHVDLDPNKNIWDISLEQEDQEKFMERVRWFHLGYHFDYNHVDYKQKHYYGFPEDLADLMRSIAFALGFSSYIPETAIINYYPIGSSMGGHTDHYEEELNQPLISVSFGQPAVFLIGGPTRDICPQALWIRSGDILVMSGPSRVAFHAVPCIVKGDDYRERLSEPVGIPECVIGKEILNSTHATTAGETVNTKATSIIGTKDSDQLSYGLNSPIERGEESDDSVPRLSESTLEIGPGGTWCACGCHATDPKFDVAKFKTYMSKTRININVRQVHKHPHNELTACGSAVKINQTCQGFN